MNLLCRLGRHRASAVELWNDGHFFSFCIRCGGDLVRGSSGGWRAVRAPLRVGWRPRRPFDLPWTSPVMPEPPPGLPCAPEWRDYIAWRARAGAPQDEFVLPPRARAGRRAA